MNKNVVLGVTSGIAAFKTLTLIKLLREKGINVSVIMTEKATHMIASTEFENASGNHVFTQLFQEDFDYKKILQEREVEHIALADKADVMVIAPATANTIAKLASGIADDFLTTTALAVTAPVILCPSMNVNMWHNPLVQENIKKLQSIGFIIINPVAGMLACGYEGVGRLAEIKDIAQEIERQLAFSSSLKGKKILITSGGTREKIDEVRFIGNRSSGKMGLALAEACYERGAEVLLLRSQSSLVPRYHFQEKVFTTTEELLSLMKEYVPAYDYCYHAAAVSDFMVKNTVKGKLSSSKSVTLTLEPQIKIINEIKQINPNIRLIGFKAEYESNPDKLKEKAQSKLQETLADAIIVNDVSRSDRGFESDDNEVLIILSDGTTKHLPLTSKKNSPA